MPFTSADATKHTKKATSAKLKGQWAATANSVRDACIKDGGDAETCDASAIKQANAVIAKEVEEMADIQEAMTKSVAGHNLKSSDFLVVEDPEKTTTWHLPVKVNGKADRRLAAAAWAALFSAGGHRGQKYAGPKKAEAKRKLKALYKSEGWEEPASEAEAQAQADLCEADLEELYGYADEQPIWVPATSFANLNAQREAKEKAQTLRELTDDLQMLVDNIMWSDAVPNKVSALRAVFDEYLAEVQKQVGEEMLGTEEPEETVGAAEGVDLEEQAAMLSITEATIDDLAQFDALLAEQHVELSNPRRAPVLVDFAIIKPGHGNQKDKRYYPAEMLERDGGQFEGVDIFVTNHDATEKTERNKVGRFRNVKGLAEQGLIGTAILYDPDVAEKARNRADARELDTLHCSIFASGTGQKEERDGQEVTVIESITKVHSVDLVSRAGAGGHAIALTESEEPMKENQENVEQTDKALEEAQPEVVEIRESDEAPVEEAGDQEPAQLSADSVATILAESGLDEKARKWLENKGYKDEAEVKAAIAEMEAFIAEIAPHAGEPFALGEAAAPVADVPKLLSQEELEERARKRFRGHLAEIAPSLAVNL